MLKRKPVLSQTAKFKTWNRETKKVQKGKNIHVQSLENLNDIYLFTSNANG